MFKTQKYFSVIWILLASILHSCQNTEYMPITIERFDIEAANFDNLDNRSKMEFESKYKGVIDIYVEKMYPGSSISTDSKLTNFANSEAINFFLKDVVKAYPDLNAEEKILGYQKHLFEKELELSYPEIYTAVIPYNQSILLNDTILIVGLNHFLGSDYAPYESFAEYTRTFKTREKITYCILEAILKSHFPYETKDGTLLEAIMYEGIIAETASQLQEDFSESLYFSITQKSLDWCKENENKLWNQLLIDDCLYSTSEEVIASFINPAPFTPAFTNQSPGKAACWLGYRIINKYIRGTDIPATTLLKTKSYQNSQKLLIDSKYNGK